MFDSRAAEEYRFSGLGYRVLYDDYGILKELVLRGVYNPIIPKAP